ncbi:MAG: hypothetical protein KJ070_25310 [Verrucomicrobia bacterium]|nr:hypothetical protein [Verrucomicrobiota bacterium]
MNCSLGYNPDAPVIEIWRLDANPEGLRYEKVILATDADVDGMHIGNSMLTYFFRFFEQVVHDGHVCRRTARLACL